MSIPVEYRGEKYFITDEKTMEKYNCFFAGFIWLGSSRYKKYLTADRKILVEVQEGLKWTDIILTGCVKNTATAVF